ncbi:MAG: hypothetical protein P4M14_01790 [Gammaproteobacteria bacterium]|nr:hypothetical protein [Gammaproteobacteria bacterium]
MASSSQPLIVPEPADGIPSPILEPDIQDLLRYISGEHIAHTFAYTESLEHNSHLMVDGVAHYQLLKLNTVHSGLVVYIFKPLQKNNSDVHVVFRGTQADKSLLRDVESGGGAGNLSFKREEENLMAQINHVLGDIALDLKVTITMYGHSLGAADAQYCYAGLMKKIADKSITDAHYSRIQGLRLMAYSAPGIPLSIASEAEVAARSICSTVNLELYWLLAAGDGVQSTGQKNLLSNVKPDVAKVHLLKVYAHDDIESKKFGWLSLHRILDPRRTITAHCTTYFGAGANPCRQEYYNNFQPHSHAVLSQKLDNKSYLLQSQFFILPQAVISTVAHWFYADKENAAAAGAASITEEPQHLSQSDTLLSILKVMSIASERAPALSPKLPTALNAAPLASSAEKPKKIGAVLHLQLENEELRLKLAEALEALNRIEASQTNQYPLIELEKLKRSLEVTQHAHEQSALFVTQLRAENADLKLMQRIHQATYRQLADLLVSVKTIQAEKQALEQQNQEIRSELQVVQHQLLEQNAQKIALEAEAANQAMARQALSTQLETTHHRLLEQEQKQLADRQHIAELSLQNAALLSRDAARTRQEEENTALEQKIRDLACENHHLRSELITQQNEQSEQVQKQLNDHQRITELSRQNQDLCEALKISQESLLEQEQKQPAIDPRVPELAAQNAQLLDENAEVERENDALRAEQPPLIIPKTTPWWKYVLAGAAFMLGVVAVGAGIGAVLFLSVQTLITAAVISSGVMTMLTSGIYISQQQANDNYLLKPVVPALPVKPFHHIVLPIRPEPEEQKRALTPSPDNKGVPHAPDDISPRSGVQSNGLFAHADLAALNGNGTLPVVASHFSPVTPRKQ